MLGRGVEAPALMAACIGTGTLAGFLYFWHAKRRPPTPYLDLSLLKIPTFAVSVLAGTLFRVGVGAIPFLLPLMFQIGFGDSAAQSGLVTFASAIGAILMKPAAQRALRTFGFRSTLFWNAIVSALGVALCACFRSWWPLAGIYASLILAGFLRSLQFTAYNTNRLRRHPRERNERRHQPLRYHPATLAHLRRSPSAPAPWRSRASGTATPPCKVSDFAFAFVVVRPPHDARRPRPRCSCPPTPAPK